MEIQPERNLHTVLSGISDFSENQRSDGRTGPVEQLKWREQYTSTAKSVNN